MDEEPELDEYPRDLTRGLGHLCGAIAILFVLATVAFLLDINIGGDASIIGIIATLILTLVLLSIAYYFVKAASALLAIGDSKVSEIPPLSYRIILYVFLLLGLLLLVAGVVILFNSSFQELTKALVTFLGAPLMFFLANLTKTVIDERNRK